MTSSDPYNLQRFRDAQRGSFDAALAELRAGRKQTHWMWFVFPQLAGLGRSPTAQFYAISSMEEVGAYLDDSILSGRLDQAVQALEPWIGERSAEEIFGPVDALKLCSSLTLFDAASPGANFGRALNGFFGSPDERTLALLRERG